MAASRMAKFMPQTSSVCSRASASKGQLRMTMVPPLRCGSYPFSASAWQVQPRSPSGLGRAPTATRAWSATLRPQSAAAAFKASAAALPWVGIRVEHWANGRRQGDVAVDIERLVQSARLINVDDLADPDIPLASLF